MARSAGPSDRLAGDCAFCTCLNPRFDVVTLKTGVRHSEFCCACGRPGPGDVVSGGEEEERPSGLVQVPRSMTLEDFSKHVLGEVHKPVWTFFHEAVNTIDFGPILSVPSDRLPALKRKVQEVIEEHLRTLVGTPMRTEEVVNRARTIAQVDDPAVTVAPHRGAAVAHQRYERTVEHSWKEPAPYDAVMSRLGTDPEGKIVPEFAPSFVGCLRALFRFRGLMVHPFMLESSLGTNLRRKAERDVCDMLDRGDLELRLRVEARIEENLRGYVWRWRGGKSRLSLDDGTVLSRHRALQASMGASTPGYRAPDLSRQIGTLMGSPIYAARYPAPSWGSVEPLLVGNDLWVNAETTSDLCRLVRPYQHERACWNEPPLRIIVPTNKAVYGLLGEGFDYPCVVPGYGLLPPIDRPLFDHKTEELPYGWPRQCEKDVERFREGFGRFDVGGQAYFVGIDPGIGDERSSAVIMRREPDGTTVMVDCAPAPVGGWTEAGIRHRLRNLHQETSVRTAAQAIGKDGEEAITGLERPDAAFVPASFKGAVEHVQDGTTYCIGADPGYDNGGGLSVLRILPDGSRVMSTFPDLPATGWTLPGVLRRFGVAEVLPGKSTLRPEDLEWPKVMQADDDAPPALASDTDPPLAFSYAPGERDAYPVGQAPGEAARWSDVLARALRGSK